MTLTKIADSIQHLEGSNALNDILIECYNLHIGDNIMLEQNFILLLL